MNPSRRGTRQSAAEHFQSLLVLLRRLALPLSLFLSGHGPLPSIPSPCLPVCAYIYIYTHSRSLVVVDDGPQSWVEGGALTWPANGATVGRSFYVSLGNFLQKLLFRVNLLFCSNALYKQFLSNPLLQCITYWRRIRIASSCRPCPVSSVCARRPATAADRKFKWIQRFLPTSRRQCRRILLKSITIWRSFSWM